NPTDQSMTEPTTIESVGFKTSELTYAAPDGPRTLPVYFWYPSAETDGVRPRYNGFLLSEGAFENAPLIDNRMLPVLLFSHGKRGLGAATSIFMLEYFARQGWLVVSWEHTGDTTFNADGTDLTYLHRPLDISAVIDHIFDTDATHDFASHASNDILVSGHSRGGYGALAVGGALFDVQEAQTQCTSENMSEYCQAFARFPNQFETGFLDERVRGLILLASGDFARFGVGVSNVQIPVMQWTAGDDRNNPNAIDGDPIWSNLSAPAVRFDIANGGHFTFTSICQIVGPLGENNGCDDDDYPLAAAHELVNQYAYMFAQGFILGDDTQRLNLSTLSSSDLEDPNVTLTVKVTE
ncbi:MAG: alpha/beta hydrolase family protein, partial [Bradymonadia bacterium]